jgi:para-nitrobenzyl esterase
MLLFTSFDPRYLSMDDNALLARFTARFGEGAASALDAYRHRRPNSSPAQIASALATDDTFRGPARALASARAAAGHPTWMYWFTWETPAFGGALRSCHALDVPFVFHNLDRNGVGPFTGDAPTREAVADAFSGAVTAFARSGDPGWPQYDLDRRTTFVIDEDCTVVDDPEPELRALWEAAT